MNNDLISRYEAIASIRSLQVTLGGKNIFPKDAKNSVIDLIEDLPAVDAETVRRGRWKLKAHAGEGSTPWTVTAYCSECCDDEKEIWAGHFVGVPDYIACVCALENAKTVELSNYCPDCGAKMEEGTE